ncbi:MAG: hypothetical protein R3E64_04005 [Halioglobus sp.]
MVYAVRCVCPKTELDKLTQTNGQVDKSGRRAGKGLDDGGRGAGIFRRQAQRRIRTGLTFGNTLNGLARVAGLAAGLLVSISTTVCSINGAVDHF